MGERPFGCPCCRKGFPSQGTLCHQKTHARKPDTPRHQPGILAKPLPPCRPLAPKSPAAAWRGKSLGKSRDLWKHQQMHMAAWPFPCLQCGCCFWLRQVLASHQKVHGGEKPFGCADCGKHFTQKHHLLSHWCIHTGEKPFACSHCGHHFSQEHNLVSHQCIRSREYPFACTHCPKAFRDKKTLTLYQHIHTGEKRRVRQDLQPEAAPEEPPAGARGLAGHAGGWLVGWGGGVCPRQGVGKVNPYQRSSHKKRFQDERIMLAHQRTHGTPGPWLPLQPTAP
ncbi:gastrula zinc finger protein XlCGF7.1-like [Falco naumanni]|uniref:gastrula zinc finger protein XlCGF7.1-like n=1 Tax=Falco naumanni TaxID=148594 RepID=UPI001ADE62A1|nr:gastrula zinc finger protein XlCGF7.1-like [Falco naumanni]